MALTTVPASLSATALTLTTAAQPNITSVGTLTGLTANGVVQGTAFSVGGTVIVNTNRDLTNIGNATFAGTGTFAGGAANNNDDANILTLNASQHARLLVDTSSTGGHRATLALESNGNELTLATTGSTSYLGSVGNLEIDGGNVIINKSNFSSLPTGSKLNIFGDGVTLRLDGSGGTTKSILFRGTNVANPGEVYADGSLRFRTEDASTRITFHTNSSGSNNERMRIDADGHINFSGPSNQDIGGTGPGTVIRQHGQLRVGTNDGTSFYTKYPVYLDRMNTAGNGPHIVFARHGQYKGGIGAIQEGGGNSSSAEGSLVLYTGTWASPENIRLYIKAGGNIGIGENNPVAKLAIKGANDTNFEIQPDISSGVNRITNFNRVSSAYKKLRVDASEHEFYRSGNPAVTFLSNGDLEINDGNLIVQNGHGIDFSDTGGPTHTGTGSSELLDDYEEGTFTPTPEAYYGNSVTFSGSFSGWYVKVGAKVTVMYKADNFQFTAGSGSDLVGFRLPFNPVSGQSEGMGNITTHGWAIDGRHLGTLLLSTSNALVGQIGSNNNNGSWAWADFNSVGSGNTSFRAIFTYFVTN